ncbi:MAG: sulfatase [Gemmatimonadetes bacterium]|nr:sulfatase [Gemmatimonadota bacterium]NNM06736.1 sulfatase [Gemmatimonadota bacterium]
MTPLLGFPFLGGCQGAEEGPPNIVFIFSDDHACQAISAYGSRINQTPNIDRIAREGAIFQNSFCSNSICAPSRAVVLTGKFSHINGKIDNRADPFDTSQPTFNKALQGAGYQTAMIGKWHLRNDPEGFDYWKVLPGQGHYYNPDFRTPAGTERIEGYVTDIVTDQSLDWLENGRDPEKPFLLMCQHKAPHRSWMPGPDHMRLFEGEDIPEPETLLDDYQGRASPASNQEMSIRDHFFPAYDLKITPPASDAESDQNLWAATYDRMTPEQQALWDSVYEPRNVAFAEADLSGDDLVRYYYQRYIKDYLRCIASVDDNVGRILDYLDQTGLAENTLIIYSSDQGFYLGEHGWYDKRWMYEESLRMPFVARWPGRIDPGTEVSHMIQNIDYAPTFLDAAGLPIPEDIQGESLIPLMEGRRNNGWRDSIYYHYYEFPAVHMVAKHYGVRTERYKLIHYYETGEWECFDLETDPQELSSVYDHPDYQEVVEQLKQELRRLREFYEDETGIPISSANTV